MKRTDYIDTKVLWLTGLSGSGKTTLAEILDDYLKDGQYSTCCLLDGDVIRGGLNKDLGFSDEDRKENIRRIGEVVKLFYNSGVTVISAFISPFESDRNFVRSLIPKGDFVEIFLDCPLSVCEERDVKGLYKMARLGEIKNFTGIDSVYEIPSNPEIILDTSNLTVEECIKKILWHIHYL